MSRHPESCCAPARISVSASGTVSCHLLDLCLEVPTSGISWESSNGNQGMRNLGKKGGEEAEFSLLWCVWWPATVLLNTDLEAVRTAVFKVIRTKFLMWGPKETFPGSRRKDGLEQWYSIRGGAILRRAAFRIYTHTHAQRHMYTCTHIHTHTLSCLVKSNSIMWYDSSILQMRTLKSTEKLAEGHKLAPIRARDRVLFSANTFSPVQPPALCFQASLRCPLCLSPPDTVRLHTGFGKSWPLNPLFLFSIRTKAGLGYFLFLTFSGGSDVDDVIWKYNQSPGLSISSPKASTVETSLLVIFSEGLAVGHVKIVSLPILTFASFDSGNQKITADPLKYGWITDWWETK